MKKHFSKILASSLILTVFLATVLCCNPQSVQASTVSVSNTSMEDMPNCPERKGKASTPAKVNDCCNPQLQAEHPVKISLNFPQIVNDLFSVHIFVYKPVVLKEKFNLAYLNGPPGLASDIPLYLSTHNFRL